MNIKNELDKIVAIIKQQEAEWQKDIDKTENPIVKEFKQSVKDLREIELKLHRIKLMHGIDIELKFNFLED